MNGGPDSEPAELVELVLELIDAGRPDMALRSAIGGSGGRYWAELVEALLVFVNEHRADEWAFRKRTRGEDRAAGIAGAIAGRTRLVAGEVEPPPTTAPRDHTSVVPPDIADELWSEVLVVLAAAGVPLDPRTEDGAALLEITHDRRGALAIAAMALAQWIALRRETAISSHFRTRAELSGGIILEPGRAYPVGPPWDHKKHPILGVHRANTRSDRLMSRRVEVPGVRLADARTANYRFTIDYQKGLETLGTTRPVKIATCHPNIAFPEFDVPLDEEARTFRNYGPLERSCQLDVIKGQLEMAGEQGATVAVLPEYAVPATDRDKLAEFLGRLDATTGPILVVAGTGTTDDTRRKDSPYDNQSCVLFRGENWIPGEKYNVWNSGAKVYPAVVPHPTTNVEFTEDLAFQSRPVVPVLRSGGWTIAVLVCRDASSPDLISQLADLGVTLLLVPSYNPRSGSVVDAATSLSVWSQAVVAVANTPAVFRGEALLESAFDAPYEHFPPVARYARHRPAVKGPGFWLFDPALPERGAEWFDTPACAAPVFGERRPPKSPKDWEEAFRLRIQDRDLEGLLALYAPDAVVVWRGKRLRGHAEIGYLMHELVRMQEISFELHPVDVYDQVPGLAVQNSDWTMRGKSGGTEFVLRGKSTVLLAETDGTWLATNDDPWQRSAKQPGPPDHTRGRHVTQPDSFEVVAGPPWWATAGFRPSLRHVREVLRSSPSDHPLPAGTSPAFAVLLPMFESGDGLARVHLTRRAPQLRSNPNHITFPGGKFEREHDRSLRDTALREAREETHLPAKDVEIIGTLPVALSIPDELPMYPYVGIVKSGTELRRSDEVSEIVKVSLAELLEDGAYQQELWVPDKELVDVFTLGDRSIFGGTAAILVSLLKLLTGSGCP